MLRQWLLVVGVGVWVLLCKWIVDASIWGSTVVWCFFCCDFVFVVFLVLSDSCMVACRFCGVWLCVSVQERMVDALASGADEGRGNLR